MNPTQDLVAREVTTAGVLYAAARYISVYGWHQGGLFADDSCACPPACSIGAMRFAILGNTHGMDDIDYADAVGDGRADAFVNAVDALCGHLLGCGAMRLADDLTEPFDIVAEWNDDSDRNVSQVLAALNTTARLWDRSHSGGAR